MAPNSQMVALIYEYSKREGRKNFNKGCDNPHNIPLKLATLMTLT